MNKLKFNDGFLAKFGDVLSDWWDSKWHKTTVNYNNGNLATTDPRGLLKAAFDPDIETQTFLNSLHPGMSNDEKAYLIHKYILRGLEFKYKTDLVVWNKSEYWQTPQQTMNMRTGDCEDASLIWMKLSELAGIPKYRRKLYCGDTDLGGHCYPVYLTEEGNRWVSMDLTYYARVLQVANRGDVQDVRYYGRVWFTFNESTIWAQHDTKVEFK